MVRSRARLPWRRLRRGALGWLAGLSLTAAGGQGAGGAVAGGELIARAALEEHVRFLADDRLAGRETGAEGAMLAARYLEVSLREAGLEPAGDGGTFLQSVPLRRSVWDEVPRLTVQLAGGGTQELVYGVDFYGLAGPVPARALKLVVVRSRADVPAAPGPDVALFVDGDYRERQEWLAGVAGHGLEVRAGSKRPGSERSDPPRGASWLADDGIQAALTLRGLACDLFRSGEVTGLVIEGGSRLEALEAANVVGRVPGRGERARETVVFTAHYDHIGTRELPAGEESGDTVFNGADDDASGCAVVLELARAFAAGPPPERTLVFLLVTGEEIGLLGTKYYLRHPVEPLEATVCNLNFEMLGRPDELAGGTGGLWLTGDERSNLGAEWRAHGIEVRADPRPEENFFARSDNYAFAVLGIVAQTLSSYDLHGDYHHVSDEVDRIDFEHMESAARLSYRAARLLADGALDPAWNPGGDPSAR